LSPSFAREEKALEDLNNFLMLFENKSPGTRHKAALSVHSLRQLRSLRKKQTTLSSMAGQKKGGSHAMVTMLEENVDKASFIPYFTRDKPF
jgi:hypothetical protein